MAPKKKTDEKKKGGEVVGFPNGEATPSGGAAAPAPAKEAPPMPNKDEHDDQEHVDPDDELVKVEENAQGDRFLPGTEPLVTRRLKGLGEDTLRKRNAMMEAKNAYVDAHDILLDEMEKKGIDQYELAGGETVYIDKTKKVKIRKKKATVEEIDELDVD